MSRVPLYWVDAFADAVGQGNPAAVCTVSEWPPEDLMLRVAAENGLSETAFLLTDRDPTPLRWFTPTEEVGLCGHATLAAGYVVLDVLDPDRETATFTTRGGELTVTRSGEGFAIDFPALAMRPVDDPPSALVDGLAVESAETWKTESDPNYFVILNGEAEVGRLRPDLPRLERLHPHGVAVSAPGDEVDFVSRYFAPSYGIPEDPVTGSIHCALGPYWSRRLKCAEMEAAQLSARGGRLGIQVAEDRVRLTGRVACYLTGAIRCLPAD